MTKAQEFVLDNRWRTDFIDMYRKVTNAELHSDRWSIVYDYIHENFPDEIDIVTDLTIYLERWL